jgi:hypothetical protein
VLKRRTELIFERFTLVDGWGSLVFGIRSWRAGLADECLYYAVKGTAIVGGGGAEGEEVLCCLWDGFTKDLEFEVTEGGV